VTPVCDKILSSKMTIKVYGSKQSTCTQRVVLALHEKEIFDYELVTVDLQKGEHKRPEFLQLQVTRRILVLWFHQDIAFKIYINTEKLLSHLDLCRIPLSILSCSVVVVIDLFAYMLTQCALFRRRHVSTDELQIKIDITTLRYTLHIILWST
jgi:hypothetical protein